MKSMRTVLLEEMQTIEMIVKEAKKRLMTSPKGNLSVKVKKKVAEYYYREDNEKDYKYLKKSKKMLAKAIAQRDYDIRLVQNGEERIKAIDTFLKQYEKTSLKKLYDDINPYRLELINVAQVSDEEYIRQWQMVEYKGRIFTEDAPEIVTERGERVRSKSEKIIADKLYSLGIPYRYEFPIVLSGNIKVYPDFTILKMPERKEVYLEHFGMLDDAIYAQGALNKINTYERNGIYIGVNLFVTHETNKAPMNVKAFDRLIKILFCE